MRNLFDFRFAWSCPPVKDSTSARSSCRARACSAWTFSNASSPPIASARAREGGQLADRLRRPGREREADQQGNGDDDLRRGGIERTGEKRREHQRERAHLQQDG